VCITGSKKARTAIVEPRTYLKKKRRKKSGVVIMIQKFLVPAFKPYNMAIAPNSIPSTGLSIALGRHVLQKFSQ
jgi:hypothetical protein